MNLFIKRILSIFITVIVCITAAKSQTRKETSAWAAVFHSQKLSDNIGLHFDAQLRSHDNISGLRNVLIRPGLTYFIAPNKNATVGYLYTTTDLPIGAQKNILTEHRIWEQFIYSHKIEKISVAHRFRLEQRFIERVNNDVFSQRLRYFVRGIIPITEQTDSSFEKGIFAALQNEIFLNIQNKSRLNNHTFDQNRAYIASGYRFNPSFDLEIGYLNQSVKGANNNIMNNVIQIAAYTRF